MILMRANPLLGPLEVVGPKNLEFFGPIWHSLGSLPKNSIDFQGPPLSMALVNYRIFLLRHRPIDGRGTILHTRRSLLLLKSLLLLVFLLLFCGFPKLLVYLCKRTVAGVSAIEGFK